METISFIGSGHVATRLAKAFFACGYAVVDIYSRTPEHAQQLAAQVNAHTVHHINSLRPADVYIIAVDDHAIPQVAQQLPLMQSLVVHTAGSVDLSALQKFPNHGVLYPLQTLNRAHETDFRAVPFFIEANIRKNYNIIHRLAESLSKNVKELDSESRARLHLAAVFAGNFVNSLLGVACDIAGAQFEYLKPLVEETVKKAFATGHPAMVQTGPARRGDEISINKHIKSLSLHPEWQTIYRLLTENIIKQATHAKQT
ncbi:MAG: DUF2520 domain-containing protein [Prevotellaceae bacterium]|jgi:predicted short-subunit dehydrogenase-like oxidoreductase (DUF2520 family)|nr:DUF2520 domain-containing protein [Prevotellaceae bacterium]